MYYSIVVVVGCSKPILATHKEETQLPLITLPTDLHLLSLMLYYYF